MDGADRGADAVRRVAQRRGLTLLETLAAVVLLGMLAVAVVSSMHRLQQIHQRLLDQTEAEELLAHAVEGLHELRLGQSPMEQPIGRDGWRLVITPLEATPTSPARFAAPPHGWVRIAVCAGATVLAEVVTAVPVATP